MPMTGCSPSVWSLGQGWSLSRGGVGPRESDWGCATLRPQEESEHRGAWHSALLGDHAPHTGDLDIIVVSTFSGCGLAVTVRGGGTADAGERARCSPSSRCPGAG